MTTTGRLEGRYALITGASRGIGRAIAVRFAREGATVAINFSGSYDAAEETLRPLAPRVPARSDTKVFHEQVARRRRAREAQQPAARVVAEDLGGAARGEPRERGADVRGARPEAECRHASRA